MGSKIKVGDKKGALAYHVIALNGFKNQGRW